MLCPLPLSPNPLCFCMPEQGEPSFPNHFTPHLVKQERSDGSIKLREVFVPDEKAREAGIQMLGLLYEQHLLHHTKLRPETFVEGGMPGTQILDNVLPHRDGKLFYLLDLKDAFTSVSLARLRTMVQREAPRLYKMIDEFLTDYGTTVHTRGLPQGAPTSPYFFNFYMKHTDEALDAFCASQGLTYSRWLDDITISYPHEKGAVGQGGLGEKARRTIREIIEETPGIKIAPKKTRLHRLSQGPVTITGVSLHPSGLIQAAPHIIQNASDAFSDVHDALMGGEEMTISHLALIHGHHGALVSMSEPPYVAAVRRQIARYKIVARLVHAQMALQDEAPLIRRVTSRQEDTFNYARILEEDGLYGDPTFLARLQEYRDDFPEYGPEVHFMLAVLYAPLFDEVLEEQRGGETPRPLGKVALEHPTLFEFEDFE